MEDEDLKVMIQSTRLLIRILDLMCNLAIVVTISIMVQFYMTHRNEPYVVEITRPVKNQADEQQQQQRQLIPESTDLGPTFLLLSSAVISAFFSIIILASYYRSHKLAGKFNLVASVLKLILSLVLTFTFTYGASLFQVPKSNKSLRNDLWAATCTPIRAPSPGAPNLSRPTYLSLSSACVAGDWSVACAYISGCLQFLIALTVLLTLIRTYFKYKRHQSFTGYYNNDYIRELQEREPFPV